MVSMSINAMDLRGELYFLKNLFIDLYLSPIKENTRVIIPIIPVIISP